MFDTLLKHAKHFTKPGRESAAFVNVYGDGSLFMTTGFIGVWASGVHSEQEHARNAAGRKTKGKMLAKEKALFLIGEPENVEADARAVSTVDVHELLCFVQALNAANSQDDLSERLRAKVSDSQLELTMADLNFVDFKATFRDCAEPSDAECLFNVSSVNIEIVLKLAKALGYEQLKMYAVEWMRSPVEFRSLDGKIRIVVMKMR